MAQTVFDPARLSAATPFPGPRPKNLGLGRETASPRRPPPARSGRGTRTPSDLIRRSTPRAPRLKRPLGRDPPRTLVHFLPPLLSLLHPGPSERRAERVTAASGAERLASAEDGGGTTELRSPELRAANAGTQLRRALLDGALRAPRRPRADPHRRRRRASDPAGNRPPRPHGALEGSVSPVRGCEAARDQVPCARSPSGTAMAAAMARWWLRRPFR